MTYGLAAAKFYDLFGSKNDLEFYKELALQNGGKALELGVGTARVAILLARAGVMVFGIDNSVHMLRAARKKVAKEPEAVRERVFLKRGDMRNFELKQKFPFIYIPASTFDHNITVEDQMRTLKCVYQHLEENGTFAFDIDQVSLGEPEAQWWIDRKEIDGKSIVVRSVFKKRDMVRRICNLDIFYDVYEKSKLLEKYYEHGEVAIIFKDEIVRLLEETGFKVVSVYGDFDKSRHQKGSPRIVLVTERK
jgi:SAM-dependent methyltransferase